MARQLLQIVACYGIGLVAGNLLFFPYSGVLAPILVVGGALLALPILILVIAVFALARKTILRHLALWCVIAPFLIAVIWLLLDWETSYSSRFDLYRYLALRAVWERALLAFVCASISSALFWYWNRARLQPAQAE
jgi:hypothetical protein